MSIPQYIFQYLLIAPRVLLLVVLVALVRHKLYRRFPFFFAYIVEEIIQACVLIALIESPSLTSREYAIAYAIAFGIRTIFSIGVLYEIFAHMFSNYLLVEQWGRMIFRWVAVLLLFGGLGFAAYTGSYNDHLMFAAQLLNRTASILQCGLLCGLFLFSTQLGLSWRSHLFGITLGVGILASTDLAASALLSQTGTTYQTPLDYFVMIAYHCCVLVWIFYLFAPERSYATNALPQHDLENWNVELKRLLKP